MLGATGYGKTVNTAYVIDHWTRLTGKLCLATSTFTMRSRGK